MSVRSQEVFSSLTARDRAFNFHDGVLYITASGERIIKRRRAATLTLGLNGETFSMRIGRRTEVLSAIAVKPLIHHRLSPDGAPIVSLLIAPNHSDFRSFCALPRSGGLALPRSVFAPFDNALEATYDGKLSHKEVHGLFRDLVAAVVPLLPRATPADPRVQRIITLLDKNVHYPLDELAAAVDLSYYRMSHLFSEKVGLPLRTYQVWQKMQRAFDLLARGYGNNDIARLAGFTDVSHFHRVCCETYGVTPPFFRSGSVEIHSPAEIG